MKPCATGLPTPPTPFTSLARWWGRTPTPTWWRGCKPLISLEIKQQLKEKIGTELPDYVVACVGGGSNAAGSFYHFLDDPSVKLVGTEAAGMGVDSGETAASMACGDLGIIHGSMTYLMQNDDGQITEPYSISAGLDYPGIGPLHAHLKDVGRATYIPITDAQALDAAMELTRLEGIIPALESAHALAAIGQLPLKPTDNVVVTVSGRGDKDMKTYMERFKL
jgi:tryptophan synthase beta chain